MSNPAGPMTDPGMVEVEKEKLRLQEVERQRQIEEAEKRRRELAQMRSGAITGARSRAANYLTSQGVDPSGYGNEIMDAINAIMGGVGVDDPNPGAYLNDIGESVYDTATGAARTRASRSLDELFGQDYERRRIADTMDDPVLAAIEAEQRAEAENMIENMARRGVINDTGRDSAMRDLDRQAASVKARLNEIGATTLEGGRQSIADIIGRARTNAGTLKLGQTFDPNLYSSDVDAKFNDWLNNLGTNIRSKVTGPLFDTSKIAAVAGAGQGAQNTRYDPKALRGIIENDDTDQRTQQIAGPIF